MGWWVADLLRDDPAMLISQIIWVIGSIVLHELAHGWAAIRQGDRTPIETGHMMWNPLVHMGPVSLMMFALVGIAWGAMPVNPSRFRSRNGEVIVALAGPAMNLALAAISILLGSIWSGYAREVGDPLWRNFMVFFIAGAYLNLMLAVFNLLPVPPLDGSRVIAHFSAPYRRLISHPRAAMITLILMILLLSRGGSVIGRYAAQLAGKAFESVSHLLPGARPFLGATRYDAAVAKFRESLRQMGMSDAEIDAAIQRAIRNVDQETSPEPPTNPAP